jgi:iron-sulfur cluster assembly protein
MISITEVGAQRVAEFLEKRGSGIGLRIAINTTGCSGYAYNLEFVDTVSKNDTVFESNRIKIIIDNKWLTMVDGTELDYVHEGLNEGFEFHNPNTKATCGCGESFTV